MTETELKQAQKLASVGTGKRWENVSATQQDILDAIDEAIASKAITPEDGQYLKDAISNNNVHAFKMASPKKRSMSFRTGGSENEGLWEYLVNQIKTEDDYNDIVAQIPAFGARYKWVGGNEPIKSNLSQKNGRIITSDGRDLYSTDSFWGDNRTEAERASYMANVESGMSFGSMYLDVANILEQKGLINKKDIGRMAYEAIGATPVSEYSGMSGIGAMDRGESRARFSTRAKENVRKQLNELVAQKKITQDEAEEYWKELLDEYGGDQRDKNIYNIANSAARNKKFSDLGLQDKKTYQLVFGGTGSKSGELKNGSQLQGNQINIADLVLGQLDENGNVTSISADKITEGEYGSTGLSKIYEILRQKGEELGDTAQVQISFDGLDKDTVARLKAAGFKDGQILAIGPEDEADLSGNIRVDSNSRYSVDLLRNAQRLINDKNAQLEESFAKRSTKKGKLQVGNAYQYAMKEQTKSGGDLYKKAASKKAKMSANMKVVAMKENGPFGVISYQGALDLLGLGANPTKDDVEIYYEKLAQTIQQDEKLKNLSQFKNINAEKFKKKSFKKQKEEYQKLVENYVGQVQANDLSLPAWILRNPIINESNLRQGLKINSKDATQGSDVIMLPEMLAEQLKADFDGDIVQVLFNLASKNSKVFNELVKKAIAEQKETEKRLEEAKKGQPQKTNADYSEQYLKEAQVITNPQAVASFTNVTKQGQFGLGLASYNNTETQFNLKAYRQKHKKDTPEQIIKDNILGALAASVVEQNGISAKKGLERVLGNPDAAWDGDNLNKLRNAFFNYSGTKEQKALIEAYSKDVVDSGNFQTDPIIQTLITAMEQTYGKDAMQATGLFDEKKLANGQYALKKGALSGLLKYTKKVNTEASSKAHKDEYKKARDQYYRDINTGTVGGPAMGVYLQEANGIGEVSDNLEEHNDLMPEAIQLEKEKAKASENLADAAKKEADALEESTEAMREHIKEKAKVHEDSLKPIEVKFHDVDDSGNPAHYYTAYNDETGEEERVLSATQYRDMLMSADDPNFARAVDFINSAVNSTPDGEVLSADSLGMDQKDFDFYAKNVVGKGLRGTLFHSVIDSISKLSNQNPDMDLDELEKNWMQVLENNEEVEQLYSNLAKLGLNDDNYVRLEDSVKGYFDAIRKSGMSFSNFSETALGFELDGSMGKVRVALTPDQLMNYIDQFGNPASAVVDNKRSAMRGYEAFQLTLEKLGLLANKDNANLQGANVAEDMKLYIANVQDGKTQLVEFAALTMQEIYEMLIMAQNGVKLTEEDKENIKGHQLPYGKFTGDSGVEEVEVKNKIPSIKAWNTEYRKYLDLLAEEYKIKQKIEKLDENDEDRVKDESELQLTQAKIKQQEERLRLAEEKMGSTDSMDEESIKAYNNLRTSSNAIFLSRQEDIDEDINKKLVAQENKKQNNAIKDYKTAYDKQLSYERDIAKLQKEMQVQSGDQLRDSETQLTVLQRQLGVYTQITNGYDRGAKTLNGVKLTDEQILQLEKYIANAQGEQQVALSEIATKSVRQQGLLSQIIGGFKNTFRNVTDYSLVYTIIGQIKSGIHEVIQATKELDAALVDIQIATGNTRNETKQLLIDYSNLADELGRTTQSVATASNDWLRAGYQGKEATELTRASMMLSTLGMIDASDATTYLISTLKGWKIQADEVIDVVDKLTVTICGVCLVTSIGHGFKCR